MEEKGYIKFNCAWEKSEPIDHPGMEELICVRNQLYELKLIGCYENGIGYGNVSVRTRANQFLITGSATGGIVSISKNDFSLVTEFNSKKNYLKCTGPAKASSESLSHAAIYETLPDINAVIHIHSRDLWEKYLKTLPCTNSDIEYGTPEMADEISRLCQTSHLLRKQILVMGGHPEGLISIGKNLDEAKKIIFHNL